jgi:hypothetical protein
MANIPLSYANVFKTAIQKAQYETETSEHICEHSANGTPTDPRSTIEIVYKREDGKKDALQYHCCQDCYVKGFVSFWLSERAFPEGFRVQLESLVQHARKPKNVPAVILKDLHANILKYVIHIPMIDDYITVILPSGKMPKDRKPVLTDQQKTEQRTLSTLLIPQLTAAALR